MGYRKQPFGYRMETGKIAIHPEEADLVKMVFNDYLSGATYKALTEKLNATEVRYYPDKPWNINMVDRILKDSRYTGERSFPSIIERKALNAVSRLRAEKATVAPKTEAQKVLRQILGCRVPDDLERSVLFLLNQLIRSPGCICTPSTAHERLESVHEQISRFEEQVNSPDMDEAATAKTAMKIASARYGGIGREEYETERMRRILAKAAPMAELDAVFLKATVSEIRISGNGTISLILKNGQKYKGSDPT